MNPVTSTSRWKLLAASLMLLASSAALAGSITQNITLAGTISPPPASCAFQGPATITFNASVSEGIITSSPADLSFNCTAGTSFSIMGGTSWNPVTVNGNSAGMLLSDADTGYNISSIAITGTGTGSLQTVRIAGELGGASFFSNLSAARHVGTVAGTVTLTLSY